MKDSIELISTPVLYSDEIAHGVYGRFKYPQKHIFELSDKPAVSFEIAGSPRGEVKKGNINMPKLIVDNLIDMVDEISKGYSQEGLHTAQTEVKNNCARFVNEVCGIEFSENLLTDTSDYNGWELERKPKEYEPEIGEVMVYKRLDSNRWRHWGIGVGGDLTGVLSLPSANAHWLTIASSSDIAKGYGYLEQYVAHHEDSIV